MIAQLPEIAVLRDRNSNNIVIIRLGFIGRRIRITHDNVDLCHLESGIGDFEINVRLDQGSQFEAKIFLDPFAFFSDPVVGEPQRPDFLVRQIFNPDDVDFFQAKQLCGLESGMAGDDIAVFVDQDRDASIFFTSLVFLASSSPLILLLYLFLVLFTSY